MTEYSKTLRDVLDRETLWDLKDREPSMCSSCTTTTTTFTSTTTPPLGKLQACPKCGSKYFKTNSNWCSGWHAWYQCAVCDNPHCHRYEDIDWGHIELVNDKPSGQRDTTKEEPKLFDSRSGVRKEVPYSQVGRTKSKEKPMQSNRSVGIYVAKSFFAAMAIGAITVLMYMSVIEASTGMPLIAFIAGIILGLGDQ